MKLECIFTGNELLTGSTVNTNISELGKLLTANGLESITVTQPQKVENTNGKYTITGTGSGHNIGLSQEGAKSMAKLGFTFEEIIEFYFTGAKVDYYDPN